MAHPFGGASPLLTRQGEVLADRQGLPTVYVRVVWEDGGYEPSSCPIWLPKGRHLHDSTLSPAVSTYLQYQRVMKDQVVPVGAKTLLICIFLFLELKGFSRWMSVTLME